MKGNILNQALKEYTANFNLEGKEVLYIGVFDETRLFSGETYEREENERATGKMVQKLSAYFADGLTEDVYSRSVGDVVNHFHDTDIDVSEDQPRCFYGDNVLNVALLLSGEWRTWNLTLDDKLACSYFLLFIWDEHLPELYDVCSTNLKTLIYDGMTEPRKH